MASTREQMIDAAERLAAEGGIGAMSLREVQAASNQRNKSAAQYHFGSREGLVEAVVATRMGPINARRLELLAALDGPPDLRAAVEALVEPLAEATRRPDSCWARFLAQGWADPVVREAVRRSFEASSYRTVRRFLLAELGHLPPAVRRRRVDLTVGLVVMTLAEEESARADGRAATLSARARTTDLVDACVGLLSAPSSATSPAAHHRQTATA